MGEGQSGDGKGARDIERVHLPGLCARKVATLKTAAMATWRRKGALLAWVNGRWMATKAMGHPTDRILLHGLVFHGKHGVFPEVRGTFHATDTQDCVHVPEACIRS